MKQNNSNQNKNTQTPRLPCWRVSRLGWAHHEAYEAQTTFGLTQQPGVGFSSRNATIVPSSL